MDYINEYFNDWDYMKEKKAIEMINIMVAFQGGEVSDKEAMEIYEIIKNKKGWL
jgi:hypothetical protein